MRLTWLTLVTASLVCLWFAALGWRSGDGLSPPAMAFTHGVGVPVADVKCTITTGTCTGTGGGSSLFTAATCNGVADDAPAFTSFNTWAVSTWQASHTGLIELDIPSGKTCEFISGDVNNNHIGVNIKRFQIVGYGATMADNGGTGGGFFLGCGGGCGVQFNGTASTVRLATVAAGASSITLLDTAKCSLFSNGDAALIAGIDPQGFGDPPNPQVFEWVTISSTASCAGSGVITLSAALASAYKSTWPSYNSGDVGHSDQGGPATLYQLANGWATTQGYYGLTIDQRSGQTNANGQSITFRDVTCSTATVLCIIPSQNQTWTLVNVTATAADMEFDKIVDTVNMTTASFRQIKVQSGNSPKTWNCTSCTVTPLGVSGTAGITTFRNSSLADLGLGAIAYGASGAFTATNTVISSLERQGANLNNIATRGVWSSGSLTVPQNMTVSSFANNGSGLIRLTVPSTAGWTTNIVGDGCGGTFAVTVIDSTHVDLQGSTYSAGVCTGTSGFGSLPLPWAIPRANVYFSGTYAPLGSLLQVADLAVGANNSTVVTFNQNGSAYAGGFPTLPGSAWTITVHPAPSWSCVGCTGAINVTDVSSASATGLPFGAYVSRVVTAANSNNAIAMQTFGLVTEVDVTVTAACGAASNLNFQSPFFQLVGNGTIQQTWNPTINAAISSATPRVMTPTTTSGAQSGDTLAAPGANTWMVDNQILPKYSVVGNCASASTTVTFQTNQSVVYP